MAIKFDARLAKFGGTLVLATASLAAFLHGWEDGKPFPKDGYLVYADRLALNLPTTCYGMTKHVTSVPPIVGERWSKERCDREYNFAITNVQLKLLQCFTGTPPQSVFDMASSHAWNNGVANTCASAAMRTWNEGDWELGCRRMSKDDEGKWVWSFTRTGKTLPNGKPELKFVQGLANRRAAETVKCLP